MSVSVTEDHLSMSLGDIIKESQKQKRKAVKNTPNPKRNKGTAGANIKKTQSRTQRDSAVNRARGIATRTKSKNNVPSRIAKNLTLRARQRRTSRGTTTSASAASTARLNRRRSGGGGGGGGAGKALTTPNETLKITVKNDNINNRPAGNIPLGGARRLRRPVRQAPPRRTQAERRMGLVVQQRLSTADRRAQGVSARRGIVFSDASRAANGANGSLRQPRSNPRLTSGSVGSARLRLGTQRAIRSARGGNQGSRGNSNTNNNSQRGGNQRFNDYNDDPFFNFRNNRRSNQQQQRSGGGGGGRNRNNNNNYDNFDNFNNYHNNGYSNGNRPNNNNRNNNNRNNNNSGKGTLNTLFRQQQHQTSSHQRRVVRP